LRESERKRDPKMKKILAIAKRVLRWIGLGLVAVLLVLALVFQAPWKVITLLLVFLLACIALPRRFRKWFWLSVGVVVIFVTIWVFLPEDDEGWRPYTFDEELAALEAKYAIPDSENAAVIYNKLLEDHDPNAFWPDFLDPESEHRTRSEPWSSKDYPELAEWLKSHEATIEALVNASQIEECHFPIFIRSDRQAVTRLTVVRRWARLLLRAANNDLAEGRIDRGLEKLLATLHIGKHEYQQPTTIDMLVGIPIEALAIGELKRFIVKKNGAEEHLNVIETALTDTGLDWSRDLPRTLEYEKLIVKNLLGEYYEIDSRGRIRLSRDPKATMRAMLEEWSRRPEIKSKFKPKLWINPNYGQRKLIRAKTILYWFYLPSNPEKGAQTIDATFKKYRATIEPDFDWQKGLEQLCSHYTCNYRYLIEHLTSRSVGYLDKIHLLYLRTTAEQRGTLLMIALRRYKDQTGHWPESLDEVRSTAPAEVFVDPICGDSFVYKRSHDEFILYSKGKNGIDDGGERDKYGQPKTGADDWRIWPTWDQKAKKETGDAERQ
jgi:hypothetical protein